ncbi:MAG: YicC/YloC family endoribonuclease [Candidatus Korobacteraceae bacterium]|jgi:uncharacterized protein (TIGR00255 family)
MTIRSMTGFAQVKGQSGPTAYTVSLKSVNHRFLDLHLRMPPNSNGLENKLCQIFKQRLHRGHIEMSLTIERAGSGSLGVNRELVAGYVHAFRQSAAEFGLTGEPDLNAVFRLNGVLNDGGELPDDPEFEPEICRALDQAIEKLDAMRATEGEGTANELRAHMKALDAFVAEVEQLRSLVLQAYVNKVQSRIQELIGAQADPDRILQEAAMLAERSDIQEEVVRMQSHVRHFIALLDGGGEVGKKLDFLLQEMSREANTMLSKISGVAGEALRMTELGLAMKAEIEKSREQIQNLE